MESSLSDTPTLKDVLAYWFGNTKITTKEAWRGNLWWNGMDAAIGKEISHNKVGNETNDYKSKLAKHKEAAMEIRALTDEHIQKRFGSLFRSLQLPQLLSESVLIPDKVAAVILWDQLARHAFRGTPEAFAFDKQAETLALHIWSSPKGKAYLEDTQHWNHALFCCMALMHPEDFRVVTMGLAHLQALQKRVVGDAHLNWLPKRLNSVEKSFLQHLDVLIQFKRYPSRNEALGRQSTAAELEYLNQNKLPKWAKSQINDSSLVERTTFETSTTTTQPIKRKKPLRILVLHGARANLGKFKQKVKQKLKGLSSPDQEVELDYIKAPHIYRQQETGEKAYLQEIMGDQVMDKMSDNRCWWFMLEETQRYVGIEQSIRVLYL